MPIDELRGLCERVSRFRNKTCQHLPPVTYVVDNYEFTRAADLFYSDVDASRVVQKQLFRADVKKKRR